MKRNRCGGGDFIARQGEWYEVFDEKDNFVYSFKATSDMCKNVLNRYLVFKADLDPNVNYKIKRVGK